MHNSIHFDLKQKINIKTIVINIFVGVRSSYFNFFSHNFCFLVEAFHTQASVSSDLNRISDRKWESFSYFSFFSCLFFFPLVHLWELHEFLCTQLFFLLLYSPKSRPTPKLVSLNWSWMMCETRIISLNITKHNDNLI